MTIQGTCVVNRRIFSSLIFYIFWLLHVFTTFFLLLLNFFPFFLFDFHVTPSNFDDFLASSSSVWSRKSAVFLTVPATYVDPLNNIVYTITRTFLTRKTINHLIASAQCQNVPFSRGNLLGGLMMRSQPKRRKQTDIMNKNIDTETSPLSRRIHLGRTKYLQRVKIYLKKIITNND